MRRYAMLASMVAVASAKPSGSKPLPVLEGGDHPACWTWPQSTDMPTTCAHHRGTPRHHALHLEHWAAKGYGQYAIDGVLWALFEAIGAGDKRFVEFGVQKGCECNTRWLRERCGWSGVMLDGRWSNASINLHQAIVTPHNIAGILLSKGVRPDKLDLLSIDVDDQDWHIWRALAARGFRPRVVVVEAQFQRDDFVTPIDQGAIAKEVEETGSVALTTFGRTFACDAKAKGTVITNPGGVSSTVAAVGSSVLAFVKLATALGYTLVLTMQPDAYFVRNDVLARAQPPIAFAGNLSKLYLDKPYGARWNNGVPFKPKSLHPDCVRALRSHGFRTADEIRRCPWHGWTTSGKGRWSDFWDWLWSSR